MNYQQKIIFATDVRPEKMNRELFQDSFITMDMSSIFRKITKEKTSLFHEEVMSFVQKGILIPSKLVQKIVMHNIARESSNLIIGQYPKTVEQLDLLIQTFPDDSSGKLKMYFLDFDYRNLLREEYLIARKSRLSKFEVDEPYHRSKWKEDDFITKELISKCQEKGIDFDYFSPRKNILNK